jgi:hypothetical protein
MAADEFLMCSVSVVYLPENKKLKKKVEVPHSRWRRINNNRTSLKTPNQRLCKKPVDYLEPWLYLKPFGLVNLGIPANDLKITHEKT